MMVPFYSEDIQYTIFQKCHPLDLIYLKRSCTSFHKLITQNAVLRQIEATVDLYRREMTDEQVQRNLLLLFNHIEEEFTVADDFSLGCAPRQRAPFRKVIFIENQNKELKTKTLIQAVAKTLKEVTLIHETKSVYVWEEKVKNSWQIPIDGCMNKVLKSSRYSLDKNIIEFAQKIMETAEKYPPILAPYRDPSSGSDVRSAPPSFRIEGALFDKAGWCG